MDGSVDGDIAELSYSPIVVSVYFIWGLIFLVIVVSLCTVGLVPLASHVRCCACFKRKPVTTLQMDIEPYFTSLHSLARFTVETGDNIDFEDEGNERSSFIKTVPFHEVLSENYFQDIRRSRSPSVGRSMSCIGDEPKNKINLKASLSVDSLPCEYVY